MLAHNLEELIAVLDESETFKSNTKTWSHEDWDRYLFSLETQTPEEEIYVGTANDLENYLSRTNRNRKRVSY